MYFLVNNKFFLIFLPIDKRMHIKPLQFISKKSLKNRYDEDN